MKKLVLFGDSLFANVSKRRQQLLESYLPDYDVYNCGTGGWDSNDCVQKGPYIAQLKPDILMLSLGTNDACPWKQVDLQTFRENLPKIFECFADSQIVYFLPPPVNEAVLADDPKRHVLTNEIVKSYHDAAKELCETHGVIYLDSWKAFMPLLENGQDYHIEDGIHLSDQGYEYLLERLAGLINARAKAVGV